MNTYKSIKELVIDAYNSEGGMPSREKLTELVKANFPNSKWIVNPKSHYAWYKSKINTGEISISGSGMASEDEADPSDSEIDNDISESIETRVSLESDLHKYLADRLTEIEPGLTLVDGGIEYQTEAGRIDILAKTAQGQLVVIELKAGKAKDGAIGQLLGYMGCLASQHDQKNIRGILVASSFDDRVKFASKGLPQIKLFKYELRFKLEEIV
jgi:hypothetical protein